MSEVLQALQLLKQKQWVDLTHTFNADSPHFNAFSPAQIETLFTHDDGFFAQQFSFAGQYGTHIDAPIHFVRDTKYLEEIALADFSLPLVVLDFSQKVAKNADFRLEISHIKAFEKAYGKIEAGSFVALRTDWSKRWPDAQAFANKDEDGVAHTPGWSLEALQFLIEERAIVAVGHETLDTDSGVDFAKNGSLIAEYYILAHAKYQVEVLTNLDQLPAKGAVIFNIAPKPKKASGFPVRSFAILP